MNKYQIKYSKNIIFLLFIIIIMLNEIYKTFGSDYNPKWKITNST